MSSPGEPSGPSSSFPFNFNANEEFINGIRNEFERMKSRVEKLIYQPKIAERPFLSVIFQNLPPSEITPEDLLVTGKALMRLSELWPEYCRLQQQIGFIDFAQSDPKFVTNAFCDFSGIVNQFVESVQNDG